MLETIRLTILIGLLIAGLSLAACSPAEEPTPTPLPAAHLKCPNIPSAHVESGKVGEPVPAPPMGLPIKIGPELSAEILEGIRSDLRDPETAAMVGLDANWEGIVTLRPEADSIWGDLMIRPWGWREDGSEYYKRLEVGFFVRAADDYDFLIALGRANVELGERPDGSCYVEVMWVRDPCVPHLCPIESTPTPVPTPTPSGLLLHDTRIIAGMIGPRSFQCLDPFRDTYYECMIMNGQILKGPIEGLEYEEGYAYHLVIERIRGGPGTWRLVELRERIPEAEFDEAVFDVLKMWDRPCPSPGEPVDDFWREAVIAGSDRFFEHESRVMDPGSARVEPSKHIPGATGLMVSASADNGDGPLAHCMPTWFLEVAPWRDRCAKLGNYAESC